MTCRRDLYVLGIGIVLFVAVLSKIDAAPTPTQHKISDLHIPEHKKVDNNLNQFQDSDEEVAELENLKHPNGANTKEEILPALEKQLEEEAESAADNSDSDEQEYEDKSNENKSMPPSLQHNLNFQHQRLQNVEDTSEHAKNNKPVKALPGAARLTFGQRYEEPATTTTTTEASMPEEVMNEELPESVKRAPFQSKGPKLNPNVENLLHDTGIQFTAFDMAQYVFWSGDEAGVARSVEEMIREGLMTRENAIKFLSDIRLGIDYLQNTYASHPPHDKPETLQEFLKATTISTTTTTTQKPTTESNLIETSPTLSPELAQMMEKLPSIMKLSELHDRKQDESGVFDDTVGRLRLADFLYAEYSIEEVIYQLAKVMFSQSLTNGSEQAQRALTKLTEFLKTEGENGRISAALQKKILDVLLNALTDTLAENPALLKSAREALGDTIHKIPHHHNRK